MTKRIKLPVKTEAEVLFASNRLCCVCQKRGNHIHHIDFDPSNNNVSNLAFLCFDCHNDATITGGLSKKLTPETIKMYREHHYDTIKKSRMLKTNNTMLKEVTKVDIVEAAKTALILIEIAKIKHEYINTTNWSFKKEILEKIYVYNDHIDPLISNEILNFLIYCSETTRANMPDDIAFTIYCFTIDHFPISNYLKRENLKLGGLCCTIGFNLIYDAFFYLNDFNVAKSGLQIFKNVYAQSKKLKLDALIKEVDSLYAELYTIIPRLKERHNTQKNASELLTIFRNDLGNNSFQLPALPDYLL
jgi:hypothetical protein